MEIKLIAVDMDGTLLAKDHLTIPEINRKALKMAHDKGIIIVISSGRTFRIAEKEIRQLNCIDYMVMSNGAAVMDVTNGDIIYKSYLSKENIRNIIDILDRYPVVYEVYAREGVFFNEYSREHFFKSSLPDVFLEDYITRFELSENIEKTMLNNSIEKICINYLEEKYWKIMLKDMQRAGDFEVSSGFVGNMEITARDANKGTGLEKLCKQLGIDVANVMAFGDSGNDATMLKWAGESYAMKNGNNVAKAAAKYVTKKTNVEGGVGETIMEYLEQM